MGVAKKKRLGLKKSWSVRGYCTVMKTTSDPQLVVEGRAVRDRVRYPTQSGPLLQVWGSEGPGWFKESWGRNRKGYCTRRTSARECELACPPEDLEEVQLVPGGDSVCGCWR